MWKWILGILAVLAIVVIGGAYFGYKKMTAAGDTLTMTIAGSPERIFASLATPDSMSAWVASAKVTRPIGKGMLVAGDTLVLDDPGREIGGNRQNMDWVVKEISAPRLLVLEMRPDTGKVKSTLMMRRDSLVAQGDSTVLISTFSAPFMDSVGTATKDSSKMGGAIVSGASKVMVGALRLIYESDLKRLKARIEGTPTP
ncbi:MAG: SRPBCC family protein [Gemmatimonadota bacterium]